MNKKLVSLLLIVCLLCTAWMMTSCEKAETLVANAMEKTENLNSYEAEMKIEIDMATEGMTMNIPMTIAMKVKDAKSDNPIMSAKTSVKILSETVETDMYSDGKWIYTSVDGVGYKMSMADAKDEYDYTEDLDDMLQDLPEEALKDVEIVKNSDGSKSVTVELSDETFNDIFDDLMNDVSELSMSEESGDIKISNAKVKITIADGYVVGYDITYKMTMTIESMETVSDVKASVTFKNPGEEVTVTAPEGYEDYQEISLDF